MKTTFQANRNNFTFFMLFIGFLIIGSPGIAFFFDPSAFDNFNNWVILFPGSIFIFFAFILIASAFKMFISYKFTDNGLKIVKPPFHKHVFEYNEIESIELLNPEQSTKIIENTVLEQNSFAADKDLFGYINYLKKNTPIYNYYTIAPQASVSQVGPKDTITSIDVKKTDSTILLKLKNGDFFFLTPAQPEEFIKSYEKHI